VVFKGRYAIIGTHCCGKTTLAKELFHRKLFDNVIFEIASTFPKSERGKTSAQKQIMSKQIEYETKLGSFISDRSVIDNISYCWLTHHESGRSDEASFRSCVSLIHEYLMTNPYDMIFFVDEFFPLIDDGNRSKVPEYQEIVFNKVKQYVYAFSDLYNIPVIPIRGNTEERIKQIVAICSGPKPRLGKISKEGIDL